MIIRKVKPNEDLYFYKMRCSINVDKRRARDFKKYLTQRFKISGFHSTKEPEVYLINKIRTNNKITNIFWVKRPSVNWSEHYINLLERMGMELSWYLNR